MSVSSYSWESSELGPLAELLLFESEGLENGIMLFSRDFLAFGIFGDGALVFLRLLVSLSSGEAAKWTCFCGEEFVITGCLLGELVCKGLGRGMGLREGICFCGDVIRNGSLLPGDTFLPRVCVVVGVLPGGRGLYGGAEL